MMVSYPMNKLRGLHLTCTLARNRKVDTRGRLTSGNYPYNFRSLAAHTERRHKLYMPEQLPTHVPICACEQSTKRYATKQFLFRERSAFRLACSTRTSVSWLSSLWLNTHTLSRFLSADSFLFLPVTEARGLQERF